MYKDVTKKAEYTIWHLPEGSFGGEIRKLYEWIWYYSGVFKNLLSQYFEGIMDLKKEFIEDAKISVTGMITEIFKIGELLSRPEHTLIFSGQWINYLRYYPGYDYDLKKTNILNASA